MVLVRENTLIVKPMPVMVNTSISEKNSKSTVCVTRLHHPFTNGHTVSIISVGAWLEGKNRFFAPTEIIATVYSCDQSLTLKNVISCMF